MTNRNRSSSRMPLVLIILGLVMVLGVGAWYAYILTRPAPMPELITASEGNYPDVPRVSLADAKAAYDTGGAVFLDVRDAESYSQAHITGALSIPLDELSERMKELDPSDWIITYCT